MCSVGASPRSRPVLVLVGGAGGVGKSTIARLLSDELQFVHISRDNVKAAVAATEAERSENGAPSFDSTRSAMGGEYGQRAFAATYEVIGRLLDHGASVIVDQAWQVGLSEHELLPLVERARAVFIHLSTSPEVALARARRRGGRPGLAGPEEAEQALLREWESFGPLDLGTPLLSVDTTDGYEPSLTEIVSWIWAETT